MSPTVRDFPTLSLTTLANNWFVDKNSANLTASNTVEDVHEYCIDWKPDQLKWLIDGNEMRTVNRKDTWNGTANRFDYPQTPARIMLSLWPAGLPTNAKGTIDWAGGEIDWSSPYMQNGYYYAMVQSVSVECYDPPASAKKGGDKSYIYNDRSATNNTIELSDKEVILGSLYATGEDPEEGATTASDAPKPTKSIALVPGGGGGGNGQEVQQSSADSSASATAGGDSPQATSGGNASPTGNGQNFNQNGDGQGAGTSLQPNLGKIGGASFAIVVAILGLMIL